MNHFKSSENSTNAPMKKHNSPILRWVIGFIVIALTGVLIILTAPSMNNQKNINTVDNKQSNKNSVNSKKDLESITEDNALKESAENLKDELKNTNEQANETAKNSDDTETTKDGLIAVSRNIVSWQQPKDWQIFTDIVLPEDKFMVYTGTASTVGVGGSGIHTRISNSDTIFAHGTGPFIEKVINTFSNLTIERSRYGETTFEDVLYRISETTASKKVYLECMLGGIDNIELGTKQCDALARSFSFLSSDK